VPGCEQHLRPRRSADVLAAEQQLRLLRRLRHRPFLVHEVPAALLIETLVAAPCYGPERGRSFLWRDGLAMAVAVRMPLPAGTANPEDPLPQREMQGARPARTAAGPAQPVAPAPPPASSSRTSRSPRISGCSCASYGFHAWPRFLSTPCRTCAALAVAAIPCRLPRSSAPGT